jgi:hypothetical protein
MAFNEEQYRQAIEKLTTGTNTLSTKLNQVVPAANAALNHWYIPDWMRDAIIWCARKIISIGSAVLEKIKELLKGAVAPVYMFKYAWAWQDIRGQATDVAGSLRPERLSAGRHWTGTAASAYEKAVKPQSEAADRIGTIAGSTATSLTICASAALAFYVALGVILVKLIVATVAAIIAFGSAVFSWAGALIIIEEAGVNSALIITLVGALTAALGAQASQMASLHGEAVAGGVFAGGKWPQSTSGQFSDATVRDGDADWSLQGARP